ncbi:MAG TPA: L-aspartate oxidase [Propionibacteriaceae bacterium]|nr:L-aspartate oxidase [Propionibacteriaceae bacterium]
MSLRHGELPAPDAAWRRECDVVIVGTGAAGLSVLRPVALAGLRVEVVTRGALTDSATDWAQGGLAAVWDASDTLSAHVDDTLVAGAGLCDADVVAEVVAAAPDAIRDLAALGARFDLAADGDLDLHREGGHSARRIVHAGGDASGHEVERTLSAASRLLLRDGVRVSENSRLVDVLTDDAGGACGVRVLGDDGVVGEILAPAVVLATGGAGQVWSMTTNPAVATGDGIAAALRAGAEVRDIEFTQFHPTLLWVAPDQRIPGDRGVLISEAVRGEGAVLRDADGRRVMRGVHPQEDLAPRDVVSAAMHAHITRFGLDHLLLDATGFGAEVWEHHFPSILRLCRERGVDPVTEPIPVRPGAHYLCGGVAADLDGRTSVPGLYVVGESAATGLHGANRLASNSLIEAVIAGDRCGRLLASQRRPGRAGRPAARRWAPLVAAGELDVVRDTMDAFAGVSRDAEGLARAASALERATTTGVLSAGSLDATSVHTVATAVVLAASARTESRGCHRRSDHPEPQSAWLTRLTLRTSARGVHLDHLPLDTVALGDPTDRISA